MNSFDKYFKKRLSEEQIEIPDSVKNQIENTLQTLPEMETVKKPSFRYHRFAIAVASIVFVTIFLLPNMSVVYAKALEKIPFIGAIVRVVTIRNYYYSDEMHEMDIKVPKIEDENTEAFTSINNEIQELTDTLLKEFHKELEQIGDEGHSSLYIDYDVVMNTDTWFTLKIQIVQATGSGNITYKYYHLNKLTGNIIKLSDIAVSKEFYEKAEQEIEKQMLEEMKRDDAKIYWVENDTFGNTVRVDEQHNFYWDEKGNLIIPFDKYEVAPGYMGTPEFTIDKSKVEEYIKDEFINIIP